MVFNTGAALLDAIVLAVVSKEEKGPMGIRLPRMYEESWMYQSPLCIPCCADSEMKAAWKYTTGSATEGTAGTIK